MDETGNPTTRGYAQREPITLAVEIEPGDCFDEVIESIRSAIEIGFVPIGNRVNPEAWREVRKSPESCNAESIQAHPVIDFPLTRHTGNLAEPVVFRGALVEADGLTWWERKIRDLEANGRGKPLDEAG